MRALSEWLKSREDVWRGSGSSVGWFDWGLSNNNYEYEFWRKMADAYEEADEETDDSPSFGDDDDE